MKIIQSVKGMHDVFGENCQKWQELEAILHRLCNKYGFNEIRTPIIEKIDLFKRSLGADTDVIGKEMYDFIDKNGDHLCLRPEATASSVRAATQHGLIYNQSQKLWYLGPMFRRERPQRGRLRQFHQFGLELFGSQSLDCEVEIIMFSFQLWQILQIKDITLEINTIGSTEDRHNYKKALTNYFKLHTEKMSEQEIVTLKTNPLRLLDSKAKHIQDIVKNAPSMFDYISQSSQDDFVKLKNRLANLDIPFKHNPHLIRGLDYYNDFVFEWTTTQLGSQATICAGGRYDLLSNQLFNTPNFAVGLAFGLERILELYSGKREALKTILVINATDSDKDFDRILLDLRKMPMPYSILIDIKAGNQKNQLKKAIKNGYSNALIINSNKGAILKFLQSNQEEEEIEINSNMSNKIIQLIGE